MTRNGFTTIEARAMRLWGVTNDPARGIWILRDGRMLDGCQGGYVRDVDHSEIGQFFTRSKFHTPGSNWLYMKKFIKRGNIRMSMEGEPYFEFAIRPSEDQWRTMKYCFKFARLADKPDIRIERLSDTRPHPVQYDVEGLKAYLRQYAPYGDRI